MLLGFCETEGVCILDMITAAVVVEPAEALVLQGTTPEITLEDVEAVISEILSKAALLTKVPCTNYFEGTKSISSTSFLSDICVLDFFLIRYL